MLGKRKGQEEGSKTYQKNSSMTSFYSMHSKFSRKITLARSSKDENTAQAAEYTPKKDSGILLGVPFQYQDVIIAHESLLSQFSATMISLEFLRQL